MKQLLISLKILLRYNFLYYLILIISLLLSFYIINKKVEIKSSNQIKGHIKELKENYIVVNNSIIYLDNNYKIDDYIEAFGHYKEIKKPTNFNEFDYSQYLKSKKIFNEFVISDINHLSKKTLRNQIHDRIFNIDKEFLPLMILGINNDLDLTSFNNNGIIHLFSISGMHISILTNMLYLFLKNKSIKNNIIILVIIFTYTYITNFKIGILRSLLFLFFTSINNIFNLKIKNINLFYLTLSLHIIINPYILLSNGFYFSYVLTYFLITFKSKSKNYFENLLYTSFLCFIISFPIIIYNYYSINLLSIFYNIIFIPIITMFYILSLITSFIGSNIVFDYFKDYIVDVSQYLSNYNLILYFIKPSILIIFIYYILSYLILKKKYNYILIYLALIIIHFNYRIIYPYPELHIIDVGQGDSILYTHRNFNVLIDAGGYQIHNYIKSFGISKIDYLIITHGHKDHTKEAVNVVNNFKVKKVLFNSYENNENELNLMSNIKIPYLNVSKYKINDHIELINDVYNDENEDSLITKININNKTILLMADALIRQEEAINFKVDILKVGHHGSKTSTSSSFVQNTQPDISIISVGNNYYGHPNDEVINRLKNYYLTKKHGSIRLIIKDNIKVTTKLK